jgi:hypothetical protein
MDHDVPARLSLLREEFTNPASGIIRDGDEKLRSEIRANAHTKAPQEVEVILDLVSFGSLPVGKDSPVEKK